MKGIRGSLKSGWQAVKYDIYPIKPLKSFSIIQLLTYNNVLNYKIRNALLNQCTDL